MRDVQFGLGTQYDTGVMTAVAINGANGILEVHKSENFDTLWYRVGRPDGATVRWGSSHKYDSGKAPSCALNRSNIAVEVHESENFNTLWYHVGQVDPAGQTVQWSASVKYDSGVQPSVAMNDHGIVVEVHKSEGFDTLWYHVGQVSGNTIKWGPSRQYDTGVRPSVAINNQGLVVEVHESEAFNKLWYHVGRISGDSITWGPSRQYDSGVMPSVALTDDGFVIEVHQSEGFNTLWRHVGTVAGDSIAWSASSQFDDGTAPSVACNDRLAIQTHQSENFSTLWFTTSLITDRGRWMEQHFDALKNKSLKQITIPGSHDAGMYTGSGFDILGKTQDLSIYEQLQAGVRYFDLRPKWTSNALYIHHGLITGPALQTVIDDVQRFMLEGSRELVILKFSHYEGFDQTVFGKMVAMITQALGDWLYKGPTGGARIAEIPLGNLTGGKGQVLVVCDPVYGTYPGIYTYKDWSADDPAAGDLRVFDDYAHSPFYGTMSKDQIGKFDHYNGFCKNQPDLPCDLFLLSWTLTPPTAVWPVSKEANRNLAGAVAGMTIPNEQGQIVNIVYVDYGEYARVTDVCLYLSGVVG